MPAFTYPISPEIDALVTGFPRIFRGAPPGVWSHLPTGWSELTNRMFVDLDGMLDDAAVRRFHVLQVKEKYGGLRVYWQLDEAQPTARDDHASAQRTNQVLAASAALNDQIDARMQRAREEAATTCQRCGSSGASTGGFDLIATLCSACRH